MNQHVWKIIVQAGMVALIFIEKWLSTKERSKGK
jgi:hypothetical protein